MRPRPPRAALALLLLAGCGEGSLFAGPPALPTDGPPTALEVRLDGFGYGAHLVTLVGGDTLLVERRPEWRIDSAGITRVVPTAAQWRAFWDAADRAGVARWPRSCVNARIADGAGYTVTIGTASERRLEAGGMNAYPRADGRCDLDGGWTTEFRTLMEATSRLIGRPFP